MDIFIIGDFDRTRIRMTPIIKYIEVEKELAAGALVFKGTRVALKTLFDYFNEESVI